MISTPVTAVHCPSMKIGVYTQTGRLALGGGEPLVAHLAAGLARVLDVELVHHRTDMTASSPTRP